MLSKEALKKEFSRKWRENYSVAVFEEEGFKRYRCKNCGKFFWSAIERSTCNTPSCSNYTFIGKKNMRRKLNYVEMWRAFEKFFVKNGHESIKRYPVVDRWRPDLFFTIASIQDFQRIDKGKIVMEYPADPLVVPQVCLRFNDISNVGVTGRHHTSFIMSGQHSFGKYWKDRCIELNFRFLNGTLGIKAEELTYVEDLWAMPDFSQFGPSLETFCKGLELVNSVFSQYTRSNGSYRELEQKVIDVGWGHERLVWMSNATVTGYDCAFGRVVDWVKRAVGVEESDVFKRYSTLAGSLNLDEVKDMEKVKEKIRMSLGVDKDELKKHVEPMHAIYAILDHTRTLLFAITDGMLPSNVGGGYNLRVIARRAFSLMDKFNVDVDISKLAEKHASFLKPLFPELKNGLSTFSTVMEIERKKYRKSIDKARVTIERELKSGLDEKKLVTLYTSHGVTPEVVKETAKRLGIKVNIPSDFYERITEAYISGKKETEGKETFYVDVSAIKPTKLLFYEREKDSRFRASVVKIIDDRYVVLDQTLFYPTSGGQECDLGKINGKDVVNVFKVERVVLHEVKDIDFKEGDVVEGEIDMERRMRHAMHHTATHLINGVCRRIFGEHVWQAGAYKCEDYGRLDITHYKALTFEDEMRVEKMANEVIKKGLRINKKFMKRGEAERRYGFRIYQGGASPGKVLRIVEIEGLDVEACAGTHLDNTSQIGKLVITKSTKLQDGVVRLEYKAWESAESYLLKLNEIASNVELKLGEIGNVKFKDKAYEVRKLASMLKVGVDNLESAIERFVREYREQEKKIKARKITFNEGKKPPHAVDFVKWLVETWKLQRKAIEKHSKSVLKSVEGEFKDDGFYLVDFDRRVMLKIAEKRENIMLVNKNTGYFVFKGKDEIFERVKSAGAVGGGKVIKEGKVEMGKIKEIERVFKK